MKLFAALLWLAGGLPAFAVEAQDGHDCLRAADLVCAERVRDALLKSAPNDIETITVRDNVPIASSKARFMRLKVSSP